MKTVNLKEIDSTHSYLIEKIKDGSIKPPVAIIAERQTNGRGSQGNSWQSLEGNLFLSIALDKSDLPNDLPLSSLSIYFTSILKKVLAKFGSKVWIKWPNDFYLQSTKIGGSISLLHKDIVINSIGLNLLNAPQGYGVLDIEIPKNRLLKEFIKELELKISWKQVFSNFSVEFQKSKDFSFNLKGRETSLRNATLLADGSISVNNKKVYNLR